MAYYITSNGSEIQKYPLEIGLFLKIVMCLIEVVKPKESQFFAIFTRQTRTVQSGDVAAMINGKFNTKYM